MALMRCEEHKVNRDKYGYIRKRPICYGDSHAMVCGIKGCRKPAVWVWLNEYEAQAYNKGERIFSTRVTKESGDNAPGGAKVKVQS